MAEKMKEGTNGGRNLRRNSAIITPQMSPSRPAHFEATETRARHLAAFIGDLSCGATRWALSLGEEPHGAWLIFIADVALCPCRDGVFPMLCRFCRHAVSVDVQRAYQPCESRVQFQARGSPSEESEGRCPQIQCARGRLRPRTTWIASIPLIDRKVPSSGPWSRAGCTMRSGTELGPSTLQPVNGLGCSSVGLSAAVIPKGAYALTSGALHAEYQRAVSRELDATRRVMLLLL